MRREVLAVAVAMLVALGVAFALIQGGDASEPDGDVPTPILAPAGADETTPTYAPQHQRLGGPYRDGTITTIETSAVDLVDAVTGRTTTFLVPPDLQARIDVDHLRADAIAGVPFRIYYRDTGDHLVMRGFTHPRPGADAP